MDFDIIVVGAGPAGLSAAVRAAWLGAPAATLRARILVLEASDRPGGLSCWQPLVVNSPGVFYTKRELRNALRVCEEFGVEIRHEPASVVASDGDGGFHVDTPGGRLGCHAVVVATGCRRSHPGEPRLFHRGRIAWYYGDDDLDAIVARMEADASIRTLCVCGAEGVARTLRRIGARAGVEVQAWAEPPWRGARQPGVRRGRLAGVGFDRRARRLRLLFERESGDEQAVAADLLLVDFNAYEATATTTGILAAALRPEAGAFLEPDRRMALATPGLFCAGDVTGGPFCVAKAMSEGTVAGFSAYARVHACRTGRAPNLYPYFPYGG